MTHKAVAASEATALRATRCAQVESLYVRGEFERCLAEAPPLYEEATAAADWGNAARAALVIGRGQFVRGRHSLAADWTQLAIQAATVVEQRDLQGLGWALLACVRGGQARAFEALQAAREALQLLEHASVQTRAQGCRTLAVGYGWLGLTAAEYAMCRQVRELLADQTSDENLFIALYNQCLSGVRLCIERADAQDAHDAELVAEVGALVDELQGLAAALGGDGPRRGALSVRADFAAMQGRWADVRADIETVMAITPDDDAPGSIADDCCTRALALRRLGLVDEALAEVRRLRERWYGDVDVLKADLFTLGRLEVLAEAAGEYEVALRLRRRLAARIVANHQAVVEVGTAREASTFVAQTLRIENEELRLKNAGLRDLHRALVDQVRTDPLTALLNRRGLEDTLDEVQRDGRRAQLVMLDLDHFKQINDQWTHVTGDEVLRRVAGLMLATLRHEDRVARYGGEEFIAVLAALDPAEALEVAERLRVVIESHDWTSVAPGLRVTTSGGVAALDAGGDWRTSLARADALLYVAKADGRNRIKSAEVAQAASPTSPMPLAD